MDIKYEYIMSTTIKLVELKSNKYLFNNSNAKPLKIEDFKSLISSKMMWYFKPLDRNDEYYDEPELLYGTDAKYIGCYFFAKEATKTLESMGYTVEIDTLDDQKEREEKAKKEYAEKQKAITEEKNRRMDLVNSFGFNNPEFAWFPYVNHEETKFGYQIKKVSETVNPDGRNWDVYWKVEITNVHHPELGVIIGCGHEYNEMDMWETNYKIPKADLAKVNQIRFEGMSKDLFDDLKVSFYEIVLIKRLIEKGNNFDIANDCNINKQFFEYAQDKFRDTETQQKLINAYKQNIITQYKEEIARKSLYVYRGDDYDNKDYIEIYKFVGAMDELKEMHRVYSEEKELKLKIQREEEERKVEEKRRIENEAKAVKLAEFNRKSEELLKLTKPQLIEQYQNLIKIGVIAKSWDKKKIVSKIVNRELGTYF